MGLGQSFVEFVLGGGVILSTALIGNKLITGEWTLVIPERYGFARNLVNIDGVIDDGEIKDLKIQVEYSGNRPIEDVMNDIRKDNFIPEGIDKPAVKPFWVSSYPIYIDNKNNELVADKEAGEMDKLPKASELLAFVDRKIQAGEHLNDLEREFYHDAGVTLYFEKFILEREM